jgi:hypothetical protein
LAHYDNCTAEDGPEKRIENYRKFLELCCAVVSDDEESVLREFYDFHSGVDDLNYCFGTTLLGFAIARGTPHMLRLLLRSVQYTSIRRLEVYLRFAVVRTEDSDTMVKTLLDRFTSTTDITRHAITRTLLLHAICNIEIGVFDATVHWMAGFPNFHDKLSILESCFDHALSQNKVTELLNHPAPKKNLGDRSTLSTVSPYQFGKAYEKALRAKLTVLEPHVRRHRYKRPWFDSAKNTTNGFEVHEAHYKTPTDLFRAVSKGMLNWADWLLWAGADPRHEEGEMSLLNFAWKAGKICQVAKLLHSHGWNCKELELVTYA